MAGSLVQAEKLEMWEVPEWANEVLGTAEGV